MVQVTANLDPVNSKKVIVKFDFFKIGGLVSLFRALHVLLFFSSVCYIQPVASKQNSLNWPRRYTLVLCVSLIILYCNLLQISVKAPGRARGELEITYLDDELR